VDLKSVGDVIDVHPNSNRSRTAWIDNR